MTPPHLGAPLTREDIHSALAGHYLFQALPSAILDTLVAEGETVSLAPGQVLFRKGDPGAFLFCVLEGAIQISVEVPNGGTQVMNRLPPGSVFGELALLDDLPRSADALAAPESVTRVFLVTRADFQRLFLNCASLHEPIIRLLCERVRWTSGMVEAQGRAEAAERQRLADKERMEQSLRQWMTDTSHELRTPLAVLRAQIEALQDGIAAPDSKRLDTLHREVMGLTRLVDDLHTLARSDVGHLDCGSDPVSPLGVLDDVVGTFRGPFETAGLGLDWSGPGTNGPLVRGDPAHLRQIFFNLLQNTLRYTDAGGRLSISWTGDGAALAMCFDDTAPAVPDDALPRLFDRFFRVQVSRSRERGGSGIGLAVTRSLVEAHGGEIAATASPLGGLRVSVILPVLPPATRSS